MPETILIVDDEISQLRMAEFVGKGDIISLFSQGCGRKRGIVRLHQRGKANTHGLRQPCKLQRRGISRFPA